MASVVTMLVKLRTSGMFPTSVECISIILPPIQNSNRIGKFFLFNTPVAIDGLAYVSLCYSRREEMTDVQPSITSKSSELASFQIIVLTIHTCAISHGPRNTRLLYCKKYVHIGTTKHNINKIIPTYICSIGCNNKNVAIPNNIVVIKVGIHFFGGCELIAT